MTAPTRTIAFAEILRRWRRAQSLTQEQLAERSGLSARAISSLECGTRRPRRLTVEQLATALDLDAAQRESLSSAAADVRWRRKRSEGP